MRENIQVPECLQRYVDYLRNVGTPILATAYFDDDWDPIGPKVREQLEQAGLVEQSHGGIALVIGLAS